jgi:hypothetical protein
MATVPSVAVDREALASGDQALAPDERRHQYADIDERVSPLAWPRTSCSPCDARSHALSELLDWRSTDVS